MCEAYHACVGYKLLAVAGREGEGKKDIGRYTAGRLGNYYREVVCNASVGTEYVARFVQGAVLVGAWLSFY